ncbi:hypothetical protein BKH20_07600, partial [Actinomyces oris]
MSDLLARGPVVLDGAMGTELDARGVDTRSALWSALALTTAPDVVWMHCTRVGCCWRRVGGTSG